MHNSPFPMPWRTEDVLAATGGTLASGTPEATHAFISTDSRTITEGSIFVALVGPTHDGHTHIESAMEKGASCIVAQTSHADGIDTALCASRKISLILVEETLSALGQMARYMRDASKARIVAITGSNGKTTTRSLTEAVLKGAFFVHATRGNFNNEIGLPLTLFRLTPEIQWSVLEHGMSTPGEMTRLGQISSPDVAVITCIGESHLQDLKDTRGVTEAKAELLDTLKPGGTIILNRDDENLTDLAARRCITPIWYGFSKEASVRAENISWDGRYQNFTLICGKESVAARIPLPGKFMVQNALAAAAVGLVAGLTPSQIASGLETGGTEGGRFTICESDTGLHVIDDTYNANPLSMEVAIDTLVKLKEQHQAVAVVGDMLELGPDASRYHRELGRHAAESGIERLYITGEFSADVRKGALESGMAPDTITVGDKDALITRISSETTPGDWVLVKGSRSMGMEQVVAGLLHR